MKTKKSLLVLGVLGLVLFQSCNETDWGMNEREKYEAQKSQFLSVCKTFYMESIGTIYEPDFTTLEADVYSVSEELNRLVPDWDHCGFTELEDHSTLVVSLTGNSIHSAQILSQYKTETPGSQRYKLDIVDKSIRTYVKFTKEKAETTISYQIVTTFVEPSFTRANSKQNLSNYILYSEKEGKCNCLFSISEEKLIPITVTSELILPEAGDIEFTSVNLGNEYTLYFNENDHPVTKFGYCSLHGFYETQCGGCSNIFKHCDRHGFYTGSTCETCKAAGYKSCSLHGTYTGSECERCKASGSKTCYLHGFYTGSQCDICKNTGFKYCSKHGSYVGSTCSSCNINYDPTCRKCGKYMVINATSCGYCGDIPGGSGGSDNGNNGGSGTKCHVGNLLKCPPRSDDPCDEYLVLAPCEYHCEHFFKCREDETVEQLDCPPGLHYNPLFEVCDYPSNAGCQ